jgi:hypothetical protein
MDVLRPLSGGACGDGVSGMTSKARATGMRGWVVDADWRFRLSGF